MSGNTAKTVERTPEDYRDIIKKQRPQAEKPMSIKARAAQFAPFAALGKTND